MVEASAQRDRSWDFTQIASAAAIESVARLATDAFARGYRLLCRGMGGGALRYLESINIALHYPRLDNVKKHM